ncbi:MAG: cysteine-rich CWC family protein [Anaerolineae bacterium]
MHESKTCPQCSQTFSCGAADAHCWCFDLPHVMPVNEETGRLCPDCLMAAIKQAGSLDEATRSQPPSPAE